MSQHPSLSSGRRRKKHRSVLKRFERLKHMKEKDKWDDEKSSIFGMPKIKVVKFRVKKEKVAEEVAAEGAVAGAEGEAPVKEAAAGAQEGKEKGKEKAKAKDTAKKEKK